MDLERGAPTVDEQDGVTSSYAICIHKAPPASRKSYQAELDEFNTVHLAIGSFKFDRLAVGDHISQLSSDLPRYAQKIFVVGGEEEELLGVAVVVVPVVLAVPAVAAGAARPAAAWVAELVHVRVHGWTDRPRRRRRLRCRPLGQGQAASSLCWLGGRIGESGTGCG